MRQSILTIILSFCLFAAGAQNMGALFISMPDQHIPQLEDAWRKDLVDLYNGGKEAKLQNMMNGFSELKKLTPDYLLLQATERSTIEMKLLPLINNTFVICVVSTVMGPVPDSRVGFFSTNWEPLQADELFTPVAIDWFIVEDKENEEYWNALTRLDIQLIHYQLSPDSPTLTATFTTPLYLDEDERKKITPFIKESPKVYTWEKHHFK